MSEIAHADDKNKIPENIGVANPYALAELVAGRDIPWDKVKDRRTVLSEVLETPYEELFDPVHRSPLYSGLELTGDLKIQRAAPRPLEVGLPTDISEEKVMDAFQLDPDVSKLKTIGDLNAYIGKRSVQDMEIINPDIVRPGTLRFEVKLTNIPSEHITFPAISNELQALLASGEVKVGDWNPPGITWRDPGDFFREGGEYFDPVQGAVGDCYLIAALSSIAWASPYVIAQRTRATGQSQQAFVDMIQFYQSPGSQPANIEISEEMPLRSGSYGFVYCRSSESGEIWPAAYEKAYAKWKTSDSSDRPNITSIAGGDPVRATSELNNLPRYYYATSNRTAENLWSLVRSNSRSYKTFNPMVAWTYSSGAASPDNVNYSDANLVANHAYSILGWAYVNGRQYIVLRNPWGYKEASINTMSGYWWSYDISWWRPIVLTNPDGVFALEASTFKKYFAGLGVARS